MLQLSGSTAPSQGPRAAGRDKHTAGSFPREHRWNYGSEQLLFLNLERERAPEGQGGAGGGAGQRSCCCRAAQRVTRDAGGGHGSLGEKPTAQDTLFPFSLRSLVSFVTATFCK